MTKPGKKYQDRINQYLMHWVLYPTYYFKEINGSLYTPFYTTATNYQSATTVESCSNAITNHVGAILKENYPVAQLIAGDTIVYQAARIKMIPQ